MSNLKAKLNRVDVQVSILSAFLVLVTSLSAFGICYLITYKDAITSLVERVESIHSYVDEHLDKTSFENINQKTDINKSEYIKSKQMLESIKNATGVMYLYTAKETKQGQLIYVIDGLDYTEDFRYPGDPIETEIQEELKKALSGEKIMPDSIKNTQWGKIFVTYLPVHDGDEIIGAVGIEFEAEHQFNTYKLLTMLIPLMTIIFCTLAVICSYLGFRRISNPLYKDMSNMDRATGLKNRNAFDVDINNMTAKRISDNIAIVVMDLDKLKQVNDSLGHDKGDEYIKIAGDKIKEHRIENTIGYRIGGDEFVLIIINKTEEQIEQMIKQIKKSISEQSSQFGMEISISTGYARFYPLEDKDLFCVYKRADKEMYKDKKS